MTILICCCRWKLLAPTMVLSMWFLLAGGCRTLDSFPGYPMTGIRINKAYPRLVRDTTQGLGFPCIHIISLSACSKVFEGRENRVSVKATFCWSKDVCDDCNAIVFESRMEALKVFFNFLLGKREVIIVRHHHLSVDLLLGNEIQMLQ
jgi:hypothetical protein